MKLCYYTQVLPFLNSPKHLDPSYKTDLNFWDCFGRIKKLGLIIEEIQYVLHIKYSYTYNTQAKSLFRKLY